MGFWSGVGVGMFLAWALVVFAEWRRIGNLHREVAERRAATPAEKWAAHRYHAFNGDVYEWDQDRAVARYDEITEWLEEGVRPYPEER